MTSGLGKPRLLDCEDAVLRALGMSIVAVITAFSGVPLAPSETPVWPACVVSWPEARYAAYAFDHIVHIRNSCTEVVECVVSTNVNPARTKVAVPPRQETEVLTFRGSPAREFHPNVSCERRP